MDFDRLDAILKKRGISRRKLALAVGIKEGTMSTAYRRRSGLSSEMVKRIADYLGVEFVVILKRSEFSLIIGPILQGFLNLMQNNEADSISNCGMNCGRESGHKPLAFLPYDMV